MRIGPGTRVRVGMGVAEGHIGVATHPGKCDGRGVPNIGDGSYHPFNHRKQIWVRFDDGTESVFDLINVTAV